VIKQKEFFESHEILEIFVINLFNYYIT